MVSEVLVRSENEILFVPRPQTPGVLYFCERAHRYSWFPFSLFCLFQGESFMFGSFALHLEAKQTAKYLIKRSTQNNYLFLSRQSTV
jgi:hypothetical protein